MTLVKERLINLFIMMFLLLTVSGCSMQLVSDHDKVSMEMMESISKDVDRFYIQIGYENLEDRDFSSYSAFYEDVEVDLSALKARQEVRSMNDLTLKQANIAIQLWVQERMTHQRKNTISDYLIQRHRMQFKRLFHAMIKGESIKPTKK